MPDFGSDLTTDQMHELVDHYRAENARLVASLKEVLPILTAVRYSVGLGKNQLERVARARALLKEHDSNA